MSQPTTYRDAGVDIDAANRATEKIKELARATFNVRTLSDIGSFGGMFDGAFPAMRQPVLVASADGVGTKLKIAFATKVHNTIGRDLVNHCVNDILVQGARPLFFLDYIATGKLTPETVASLVEGVANGCRENGCVLLGGETAEMPGFYADGEYDVAGFIVGVVDRKKVIDGHSIAQGGGVLENIPRVLPDGTRVEIRRGSWPVLPIFTLMQRVGKIADAEMYRTFNMGVGMVIICAVSGVSTIRQHIDKNGMASFQIGSVTKGTGTVTIG